MGVYKTTLMLPSIVCWWREWCNDLRQCLVPTKKTCYWCDWQSHQINCRSWSFLGGFSQGTSAWSYVKRCLKGHTWAIRINSRASFLLVFPLVALWGKPILTHDWGLRGWIHQCLGIVCFMCYRWKLRPLTKEHTRPSHGRQTCWSISSVSYDQLYGWGLR